MGFFFYFWFMKLRIFIPLFLFLFSIDNYGNDWGKTGHRTVGEIATYYISKKTRKAIEKILQGESLAYVSTYADDIKSDKAYIKYNPWHYVNLPLDQEYENIMPSKEGDVVQAIRYCISQLKNPKSDLDQQQFALKFLVHIVGDIHQPMHAGIKEDRGGNDIDVKWFGKKSNLHRVWDSDMINSYGMSYTELAQNLIPIHESNYFETTQSLDPISWVRESQAAASKIYATTPKGSQLGYAYSYQFFPMVQKRLYTAGVRLAALLDTIFD